MRVAMMIARRGAWCAVAVMSVGIASAQTVQFQQGVDHGAGVYTGTVDTYVSSTTPDTNAGAQEGMWIDEGIPSSQGLIRFDSIFGNAAGQVPLGSTITVATLTLEVYDNGGMQLPVAMLQNWSDSLTWNTATLGGNVQAGIQRDGVGAAAVAETLAQPPIGSFDFDLTAIVQAWSDGQANFGVLLDYRGTDGTGIRTSEYTADPTQRPLLTIDYIPEPTSLGLLGVVGLAVLRRRG